MSSSHNSSLQKKKEILKRVRFIIFSGFLVATFIEYFFPFAIPLTIEIVPTEIFLKVYSGVGIFPTVMFAIMIFILFRMSSSLANQLYPTLNVEAFLKETRRVTFFYIGFRSLIYIVTMIAFLATNYLVLIPQGITDFMDPKKIFYVFISGLGPLCVTLSFIKIWYDYHLGKLLGEKLNDKDFDFLEDIKTIRSFHITTNITIPILGVTIGIFLISISLVWLETNTIPIVTVTWASIFALFLVFILGLQHFTFFYPLTQLHNQFKSLVSGRVDWTKRVPIEDIHELGDIIRMYNILIGRIRKSIGIIIETAVSIEKQAHLLVTAFNEAAKRIEKIQENAISVNQNTVAQRSAVQISLNAFDKMRENVDNSIKKFEELNEFMKTAFETLEVISFNARLEAVRANEPGFLVLAEKVTDFSKELERTNKEILELLTSLKEQLSHHIGQTQQEANKILTTAEEQETISKEVETKSTELLNTLQNFVKYADQLKNNQKKLKKAIDVLATYPTTNKTV